MDGKSTKKVILVKKSSFILILMSVLCAVSVFGATVNVSSCTQDLNVADNIYTLNQSINTSGGGAYCLNITAANVTLNCRGFLINSTDSTGVGIFLNNSDNSTIRNCIVDYFNISILPQSSTGLLIVNNTLTRANTSGISTIGMSDSILVNNTITNISGASSNSYGILFTAGSSNNTVRNNNISDNLGLAGNISYGIMFWNSSTDNIIVNNYLMKNAWGMADLVGGNNFTGNLIRNCTGGSSSAAMMANGSAGNIYVNNQLYFNSGDALYFISSSDHTVLNNNCSNNTGRGILMLNSSNNNISNNIFNGNFVGIIMAASDNNTVSNATLNSNDWGVAIQNSGDILLENCRANGSNRSSYAFVNVNFTGNGSIVVRNCSSAGGGGANYSDIILFNVSGLLFDNFVLDYNYSTTFSFSQYSGNFNISGFDQVNDTSPLGNISSFINVTTSSANAWIVLNISYTDAELLTPVRSIVESTLQMYRWNGTDWNNVSGSSVDLVNNIVSANLTDFSPFGLLGDRTSCGRISVDTNLTANLQSNGSNCLTINESDIVLDCKGFTIWGNTSNNGIDVQNLRNVTIRDCNILNFSRGVFINNTNASYFINNTANNNSLAGFWLESLSNNNNLIDNTANYNNLTAGSGFYLNTVNENNFTGNTADYNSEGYTLFVSSVNNTFRNNIATNNTWFGLDIVDATSPYNTFIGNNYYHPTAVAWDLHVDSVNCSFYNETVGYLLFPTTCSFAKYNGTFRLDGVQNPPTDPATVVNTSLYVNLSKPTGWMLFNISYTFADIVGLRESALRMMRYNGTDWVDTNGTDTLFTANMMVSANLTDFSAFGLFTTPKPTNRIIGGGGGSGGGGPFQAPLEQDAPETEPETVPVTPEQKQQYAPASDLDTRGAESDVDAYASRDDMRNLRSEKSGGEVSAGMSTSSIVGLVLAILVIGGAAAYLLLNSKKKAGMRKNKRHKK